jgi:D-glycero-D-manno-heptose 1,7-bisphosphate phosphatase
MLDLRKAIFLDRDGVINVDKGYVYRVEDFELINGVIEALLSFQAAGFLPIVITNQSGIGRGFFSEEEFQGITEHMLKIMKTQGVSIGGVYHCPHLPGANVAGNDQKCDCRKPAPGMILRALSDLAIDPVGSLLVGDKLTDIRAGRAAGIQHCFLIDAEGAYDQSTDVLPDAVHISLKGLADELLR